MIQIYDSRTQKKREFVPLQAGLVKMYVCGPTVYDLLHVGNFRGAIFFNVVRNWLEFRKYSVQFVYNYTDVDDKIINRANERKMDPQELAANYILEFEKDFASLGLKKHSHNPKVTEFMNPIVELVKKLIEKGKAYAVDGDVYFDVHAFPDYGKLSHKNVADLEEGVRIEVNSKKKNPADFALWKSAKPGEPCWDSPWGKGRPGWHIECSAMAQSLLGESIDIHGGGLDLLFPHHENEVAQSEAATGKTLANYWMHNNMLNFGSQKMSKSLGNVRTARSFVEEYGAEIFKYLMLSGHYRSVLDFSPAQLEQVVTQLARIYSSLALANKTAANFRGEVLAKGIDLSGFDTVLQTATQGVETALDDDFNTPEALARLFEVVRSFNAIVRVPGPANAKKTKVSQMFIEWSGWLGGILSLFGEPPEAFLRAMDDRILRSRGLDRTQIDHLVNQRSQARVGKDFKRSDELRNQLKDMGILVQDSAAGSEWEVAK